MRQGVFLQAGFVDDSVEDLQADVLVRADVSPSDVTLSREADAGFANLFAAWQADSEATIHLAVTGTPFRIAVWQALASLPFGATISYQKLGETIGKPESARAIGQAVGANPVALAIPCHRVVTAAGDIGGFRWGPQRKAALLRAEKVPAHAGI